MSHLSKPNLVTLTATAFDLLITDIEGHGNIPGDYQRAALFELVDTMTDYAIGRTSGRKAFGLPTGCGKTSAVVAWITALYRLSLKDVSVSVAASQVKALCSIKEKLITNGVPEELIGLKHSLGADAAMGSTGASDRRYQLVTHARVRGGSDQELFIKHQGKPRSVMIYDETLLRSDTFVVSDFAFRIALGGFREAVKWLPEYDGLVNHLLICKEQIETSLRELKSNPASAPTTIQLPVLSPIELGGYTSLISRSQRRGNDPGPLLDLLNLSQNPLRLMLTGQDDGLLWFQEAIPAELRNVIILDASLPVRKLVHLDQTIEHAGSFKDLQVKRFDSLDIFQMLRPGGRHSITESYKGKQQEKSSVSREIIEVIKANPEAGGILIFTFKKRDVAIGDTLLRDLSDAGFDINEALPDGRKRINLLTYGDETSLNGFDHCDLVIMAGILHRSHLDIASCIAGQKGDLQSSIDNKQIKEMLDGELAHVIYQGASRGACRVIALGQAKPMKLYLIHRDLGIRKALAPALPGARWHLWEPHFTEGKDTGVIDRLALRIVEYLNLISAKITSISTKKMKADLGVTGEEHQKPFTRAAQSVDEMTPEWILRGRSFVRTFPMTADT